MRKTKEEAQKTRLHLLNAALEVFWRNGVTRSSLQEIATEAGVTRGALYWHFKNKEDLFEALFEQKYATFWQQMDDESLESAEDVWAHLRGSLHNLILLLESDVHQYKLCDVMMNKCERTPNNQTITELAMRYHQSSRHQIHRALQLSQQQGRLPAHVDVDLAVIFVESQLVGVLKMWVSEPKRFVLSQIAPSVIDASLQALQAGILK